MKNSIISDKAAVYAISKEDALTRLSAEHDALFTQKRLSEARGVHLAMRILWQLDVHVISQADWRESRQ
jgi:hypothetical protein|nr:MAG TPA: hypothetical protein [Caudoviricetes sp.]